MTNGSGILWNSLYLVTSSLDKKYYRWLWRLPPFLFGILKIIIVLNLASLSRGRGHFTTFFLV